MMSFHNKPDEAHTVLIRIAREINSTLQSLITKTYDKETILSGLEQFTFEDNEESDPLDVKGDGA